MSWDIQVFDMPSHVRSISDIPAGFQAIPLGTRDEVIVRIKQVFPNAVFSSPSRGTCMFPGFEIEFSMGSKEICDGFGLCVHGGGNAVAAISNLLQHLQLRAIDCQTSEFFSPEAAEASFKEWQAFRDRGLREILKNVGK